MKQHSHDTQSETKKRKLDIEESAALGITLPSGSVPCNLHIREMMKIVKPYIWHLVEDANTVINFSLNVYQGFYFEHSLTVVISVKAENVDFIPHS